MSENIKCDPKKALGGCCEAGHPIENKDLMLCATCNKAHRAKPKPTYIKSISDNEAYRLAIYKKARLEFLKECIKNRVRCPMSKQLVTLNSQVHHMKGRVGDRLWDKRYFLAVNSTEIHDYIETHPKWAKKMGYSLDRNRTNNND